MIQVQQMQTIRGDRLAGFWIVDRNGRRLAIGSDGAAGFCLMLAKRYQRDRDLVAAIQRLTGRQVRNQPPKAGSNS